MKVKQKFFIFALILSLILSVGAVMAADDMTFDQSELKAVSTETDIELSENSISEEIGASEEETSQLEETETQLLGEGTSRTVDGTDFKNITKTITDSKAGDTIFLGGKNYTGNNSQITVNKDNLTIIGGSSLDDDSYATLDAQFTSRIMHVTASNVLIKNVKFINGKAGSGGAVYWNGVNGTIENSIFINNTATTVTTVSNSAGGGAVYWNVNAANGKITGSTFSKNLGCYGGAIFWRGVNGTVTQSSFDNNNATSRGGGLVLGALGVNATISHCDFINNTAALYSPGALLNGKNSRMYNCNFIENKANVTGALGIDSEGINITVDNCVFVNNSAIRDWASSSGGAIRWNAANGLLNNSNFTGNRVGHSGGAIYVAGVNFTVDNSIFTDNYASNYAGALYFNGDTSGAKVLNSIFINNSAENTGALCIQAPNSYVDNCKFYNNTAVQYGGGLGVYRHTNCSVFTNLVFINNTVAHYGGGAYSAGTSNTFINCNFTNNSAGVGGGLYINLITENYNDKIRTFGENATVLDCNFVNNTATGNGGAIAWVSPNGTLSNCNFNDNTAGGSGGAVRWPGANGALDNCNFINNNATSAGAISWVGANATITNSEFINNNASTSNGAVAFSSVNGVLSNCNFTGNSAITANNGAVIISAANTTVSDCTFKNNSAVSQGALGIAVGAVNSTISGCTFENNLVSNNQGAVVVDAVNVTVKDSTFNNNWANFTGGAISWRAANGTLTNTSFTGNNASDAGAVYWSGANGTANNITFNDNFASGYGGAIRWAGANGTVSDATFTNNHASDGGATDWAGVNGTLKDSKFIGNSANNTGGASHWSGANGTISNCEYTNNSAKIGGAIHSIADGLTVDGNTFKDNDAVYAGSDLSVDGPNTNLVNNKIDNSGSNASSVYVTDSANFTQSGNTFTDPSKSVDYASMIIEVADSFVGHADKTLTIPVYVHDANGIPALGQVQLFGYGTNHLTDGRTTFTIAMPKFQTTMYLTLVYEDGTYKNFMVEVADTNSPIEEAIQPDNGRDELVLHLPKDATGNVTVTINGKNYTSNVVDGFAVIEVNDIPNGNYPATVHYSGDANYSSITRTMNFTVKNSKVNPVTKILSNSDVTVIYSGNAYYRFFVTKDGKVVGAGESVTINFNGKNTVVKTDANGYINYKIPSSIKPKTYTIKATYYGSTVTNKVKITQVIKASNKKVKKSAKVTKIKISLNKVNGKYLKSKTLKIKFNKKTYKVKTNKKGVGTWKVKKSMLKKLKVGKKVKYTVTYGKAVVTKKLTIKK